MNKVIMHKILLSGLLLGILGIVGCGSDDGPADTPTGIFNYDEVHEWDCAGVGEGTCQDVFDIEFKAGSTVTFQATETTDGSVLMIAFYAQGEPLGGMNLFTNNESELLCDLVDGCNNNVDGQTVEDFVIPENGIYRLAITRNWFESCGNSGTYRMIIDSDRRFQEPEQSVDDEASLATDWDCPDEG